MHRDSLLGRLTLKEIDQPFLFCEFQPTEAFDEFKPLFDREVELLETGDMETWDEAYNRINDLGLTLFNPDGEIDIKEFLLHIQNNEAWFRYSSEKFE
jgi:hypothetical protein